MDRKSFSSVLDQAVGQLESEVRTLKSQKVTLFENIKLLEQKRDSLSSEIFKLEKEYTEKIKKYEADINERFKALDEKSAKVHEKEGEIVGQIAKLKADQKAADNLIKSNENLQRNLQVQEKEFKDKISKICELAKEMESVVKAL